MNGIPYLAFWTIQVVFNTTQKSLSYPEKDIIFEIVVHHARSFGFMWIWNILWIETVALV